MNDRKLKLKNIKDLEYNHILNKQNVFVIILATAIISTVLNDTISEELTKWGLALAFFLGIVLSLLHYGKKLKNKINEIKNI